MKGVKTEQFLYTSKWCIIYFFYFGELILSSVTLDDLILPSCMDYYQEYFLCLRESLQRVPVPLLLLRKKFLHLNILEKTDSYSNFPIFIFTRMLAHKKMPNWL